MTSRAKNSVGPTSVAAAGDDAPVGQAAAVALQVPVRVLDHHDRGVHHRADGDGDAPQRHDVGVDALQVHDDDGHQHRQRQGQHGHQRRAQVQQEEGADQRDDRHLLEQLLLERVNSAFDQRRPVVDRDDLDSFRQPGLQFPEPRLDPLDYVVRVRPVSAR